MKKILIYLFTLIALSNLLIGTVRAEQSGSSPESGVTSRVKALYSTVSTLGFGSDSAGTFGDLGSVWNRVYSSSTIPPTFNSFNGGGGSNISGCASGGVYCFPQSVGGVEDYNNNGTMPSDTYKSTWTTCNSGNNYCGTGRSVAEKKDNNTGLVWSPRMSFTSWFATNNCKYPNGLSGDDGVCNTNGEVACVCVKNTSSYTGCEGYDDGSWRLPNSKELVQVYIDGAFGNLSLAGDSLSSTTNSGNTSMAWLVKLINGLVTLVPKSSGYFVRCVR